VCLMIRRTWVAACMVLVWACRTGTPPNEQVVARPPAECDSAWAGQAARDFVSLLDTVTAVDRSVWDDFGLRDGWYVLNAGKADSGGVCLGLWHGGQAISYTRVAEEPKLLTPLYGYYFRSGDPGDSVPPLMTAATQPASVREWLEGLDVDRAIVMPVEVPDFPIELTPLFKVQLAIHEAFHVGVQMPRWYGDTGAWPVWDRQPDRAGVQACYTATPAVEAALREERESLVLLIDHLLDADTAGACTAGEDFLSRRAGRYEMLGGVTVAREDSTPATCGEAEALMELEEGTADYASWAVLYDLGQASREQLMRRYRAQQNDVYYLTGAMQLHAVQLMRPDGMSQVVEEIAASRSPEDGSPTAVLSRTLELFCADR
jgi:hypothetical protein